LNTKIEPKVIEELYSVVETFGSKYISEGEMIRSNIREALANFDEELIDALLKNEFIFKYYTRNVNGIVMFEIEKFKEILVSNQYFENSYTRYANKIGLTMSGKYIDESTEVVLDFPYKDSVLKAGMTKEDISKEDLKPNEMMLNEIIAKSEIDVLLDKKILVNSKRYDREGEHFSESFNIESDNLIIKGNNLLALHTIRASYPAKVKLIYIDVPYNTGSDSFSYNDKFNHSSWLTFIKNRIEVARDLLSSDGILAVNCDDNELNYLCVLLDEIFGRENFIANFPRVTKKGGKSSDVIAKNHDYLVMYSMNKESKLLYAVDHDDDDFNQTDEYFDVRGSFKLNQTLDYDSLQYSPSLDYPITISSETLYPGGSNEEFKKRKNGEHKRADWAWRWSKDLFEFGLDNGFIVLKKSGKRPRIYTKTYQNAKIVKVDNGYKVIQNKRTKALSTLEFTNNKYSNDNATKHALTLFNKGLFDYTKPETLIHKLLEITTKPEDVVLDFFMGSATTQAVALKMNRRFIGIEQMDYINSVSIPRLQKVIEGEQGGVSKDVDWQGGGSFVYTELMSKNQYLVDEILRVEGVKELEKSLNKMKSSKADINFRVDLEKINLYDNKLTLEEQKKLLIQIIDKNQLYYNYSEIEDEDVKKLLAQSDIDFNKSFYESGEDIE